MRKGLIVYNNRVKDTYHKLHVEGSRAAVQRRMWK